MYFLTLLVSLALAATPLAAPTQTASAIVNNHCSFDVYVTSVNSQTSPTIKLSPKGTWRESQHYDPKTGNSIKVSPYEDALWTGKPVVLFNYNHKPGDAVYYDLGYVYGFDEQFKGKVLKLHGPAGKMPEVETIQWNGAPPASPPIKAYWGGETDLILELCA